MYFTAYMLVLAIVNFVFTCTYVAMGANRMAIATGATMTGCAATALVSLMGFPS
jgi:hypothetical protein